MMGLSSFMTVTTTDEQRTTRFGIFSMFTTVLGIVAAPLSGVLFKVFSYVQFFTFILALHFAGFLYVVFFIDEVKAGPAPERKTSIIVIDAFVNGAKKTHSENKSNEEPNANDEKVKSTKEHLNAKNGKSNLKHKKLPKENSEKKKTGFFNDFFDPKLIITSLDALKRPRKGNDRKILILAIFCQTLFFATHGEEGLVILFARTALRWTTEFGLFVMYMTAIGLVGTTLTTALFVNVFKMQDATLGIISVLGSLAAKPIVAFSRTTPMIFGAVAVDLFGHSKYIAIKSLISKIVSNDELGRIYSILGVMDNVDLLVFAPIYSFIYYRTIDILPGAIFLFSEVFLVASLVIFM